MIVNCGDFCGDFLYILAHLATSQINLPQLLKRLNLRGLQSFCLPFNKLAKSVKMVSGTRGQLFQCLTLRVHPKELGPNLGPIAPSSIQDLILRHRLKPSEPILVLFFAGGELDSVFWGVLEL
jgi:hypothetical protein